MSTRSRSKTPPVDRWTEARDPALPRDHVPSQFLWYVLVGGLSFLADLVVFIALLHIGVPLLPTLVAGFLVGTIANYLLSLALAFTTGRHGRGEEIVRLVLVALIGLGLTVALVYAFMAFAGLSAITAKVLATLIALVWNYLGRRLMVFQPEMPERSWRLSASAVASTRALSRRRDGYVEPGTDGRLPLRDRRDA